MQNNELKSTDHWNRMDPQLRSFINNLALASGAPSTWHFMEAIAVAARLGELHLREQANG